MHILNRRSFLKRSTLGALGALGTVPGMLGQAIGADPTHAWNGNKILFVFLRGGNDALNTLIPSGDSPTTQPIVPVCTYDRRRAG